MTQYLNTFLRNRCIVAGYDAPRWTSLQITNQAGPHKDFGQGELWIEGPQASVTMQVQGARMRGNVHSTKDVVLIGL